MFPSVLFTTCILSTYLGFVSGQDLLTSIAKLSPLVETEQKLFTYVKAYIDKEKQKLRTISRLLSQMKEERSEKVDLKNPVATHLLIRRLRRQWIEMEHLIYDDQNFQDYRLNITMLKVSSTNSYPTEEDYKGSIDALLRLQGTYNLNASDIANGHIRQHTNTASLKAVDCFDIGKKAWVVSSVDIVCEWMAEAAKRLDDDNDHLLPDIVTHKVECLIQKGNLTESSAKELLYDVVHKDPQNIYANQKLITAREEEKRYISNGTEENYKALCRGEDIGNTGATNLYCHRNHYGKPTLFLKPAKEETISTEPLVLLFHDIVTDEEIELMITKANSELKRSVVDNEGLTSLTRISSVAWLRHDNDRGLGSLLRRVQDYTGLLTDTNHAEPLQVANYGLGGFYGYHYDDTPEGVAERHKGRRLATVLLYLSDVAEGGFTVFPYLGISIPPVKGSAAFWFNFLETGERDPDSLHAGCPVLVGEKWASNLWIHEKDQTCRRR